jgi:AI-2 transport protein TqsA
MKSETSHDTWCRPRAWLLVAITIILTGWALRATGAFMAPVVFSVFLALLVAPLDRAVAERVPRRLAWLGRVAAMGAILAVLLVFVGLLWVAAQQVVERVPFSGSVGSLLPQSGAEVADGTGASTAGDPAGASTAPATTDGWPPADIASDGPASISKGTVARLGQVFFGAGGSLAGRVGEWASGIATQILSAAGATLAAVVLILFLTLIMLIEAPRWREKIVTVLGNSGRQKTMDSIGVIVAKLRRYLLARTILGIVTAALYAAWLWIFGVDLLLIWALLAFLLNFIPTIGSLIAGGLPIVYAFVQKDLGTAFAVGAGILLIEQIMGNYVDPRVQGRQVALSSLVVLVTLLVWGWIWGIAGAILAVPITIAAMILCAHVELLRPFALMLSDASDMDELDRQTRGS